MYTDLMNGSHTASEMQVSAVAVEYFCKTYWVIATYNYVYIRMHCFNTCEIFKIVS